MSLHEVPRQLPERLVLEQQGPGDLAEHRQEPGVEHHDHVRVDAVVLQRFVQHQSLDLHPRDLGEQRPQPGRDRRREIARRRVGGTGTRRGPIARRVPGIPVHLVDERMTRQTRDPAGRCLLGALAPPHGFASNPAAGLLLSQPIAHDLRGAALVEPRSKSGRERREVLGHDRGASGHGLPTGLQRVRHRPRFQPGLGGRKVCPPLHQLAQPLGRGGRKDEHVVATDRRWNLGSARGLLDDQMGVDPTGPGRGDAGAPR